MTLTEDRPATASARRAMIDSQLRTSGVNEPWVLSAMAGVAREDFVPEAMKAAAYIDRAIPLGNGRALAAPLFHGKLLAEARPAPADRALLVGDGKGYLAALLAPLVGSLDSLDPSEAAAKRKAGGYSLIVVDGAAEELPAALIAQLADDGRVVSGIADNGVTRLAVGRKSGEALALLPVCDIGIPILAELAAPKHWSF